MAILFRLLSAALVVFAASSAMAQQKAPAPARPPGSSAVKVAYVDVEAVIRRSKVAAAVRTQIGALQKKLSEEIKKAEGDLRLQQQELARQQTILAVETFEQKKREFNEKVAQVERMVQARQRAFVKTQQDADIAIQKSLFLGVQELAKEHGLNLILRRASLVLSTTELDITSLVLERLDKLLPTLKVEMQAAP